MWRIGLFLSLVFSVFTQVDAQVFERVFSFSDARATAFALGENKGSDPVGLTLAPDGFFYGVTTLGGQTNSGTVFRMDRAGQVTTLHQFSVDEGGYIPRSSLLRARNGRFYGTTYEGGANFDGSIFQITPGGSLTKLIDFTNNGATNKGRRPVGRLIEAQDGNIYGTTELGGASNMGTVFRLAPDGTLTTLVQFSGMGASNRGSFPQAGLIEVENGVFYGVTSEGGAANLGTLFRVTSSGVLTTLVEFTGNGSSNKGSRPRAELTLGSTGLLYGTTLTGGTNDFGTVFRATTSGTLTTLVNFTNNGVVNRGSDPEAPLLLGFDGQFYGTTRAGGSNGLGTIFRMSPAGVLQTLIDFSGDGASHRGSGPIGPLTVGPDGEIYGGTEEGGRFARGTLFRLNSTGAMTTLVDFTGNGATDVGHSPRAPLVQHSDGSFYGTTLIGGSNNLGTVFRVAPDGTHSTLVSFTGNETNNKGSDPNAALAVGADGDFYGSTERGGANNLGTIFRMTPQGALTTLVTFNGAGNGGRPIGALLRGADGNFYGTTRSGGTNDLGTVFRLSPSGSLSTLVHFTGNGAMNKGTNPSGPLVQSADGMLYGATSLGGTNDFGTIFRMTPAGVLTTLVNFTGNAATNKGSRPSGGMVIATNGMLYGTTRSGGANDLGTVFRMSLAGTLTTLVNFTGSGGAMNRGVFPNGGLVQAADGNLYGTTQQGSNVASSNGTLFQMNLSGVLTTIQDFGSAGFFPAAGLTAASDGSLYGPDSGNLTPAFAGNSAGAIYRLVFAGTPRIFGTTVLETGSTQATIGAQINASGGNTTVALQYGKTFGSFPNSITLATGLNGFQTQLVGTSVDDLDVGTIYYFRVLATNGNGLTIGPTLAVSTLASPVVSAAPATQITPTSARFNGTVNARTFDATAVFEWGTDGNSFPNTVPAVPGLIMGNDPVAVTAAVAGLPQGGTVFFRVRAINEGGLVVSGAQSFNTGLEVSTSAPGEDDIGVTEAVFRATVNTFGQTASVKFKYWPESSPQTVSETASQSVTSTSPVLVTQRVTGLLENTVYRYQASVELAGSETDGSPVTIATQQNAPPVANADVFFYGGAVTVEPLDNDSDPNNPANTPNAGLTIDAITVPPSASQGVASILDFRSIDYAPEFNVRADDSLTYRVSDPQGAIATATVRLIAYAKRAGVYGGPIVAGSGAEARRGRVGLEIGALGSIIEANLAWTDFQTGFPENFFLKGQFDKLGRLSRTYTSSSGSQITISLTLDPDMPRIVGSFEERVDNVVTASVPSLVLNLFDGTGGLSVSGLRTALISPPSEFTSTMSDGFVRVTIGKDKRRGARIAGRLPDGEPFLAGVKPVGRTYSLTKALENDGVLAGLIRTVDIDDSTAGGIMANLFWKKNPNPRSKYERGAVATTLSISGSAYPALPKTSLPPIGLADLTPNARLRFFGGGLGGGYRDLLLQFLPGSVRIAGPDTTQLGQDISLATFQLKSDASKAAFGGKFTHPGTGKPVTFDGTFILPIDGQPAQGRAIFRGPMSAGGITIEPITP